MQQLKLVCLAFLMLFCSLVSKGQDTLVFKSGEKVGVNIIKIRKNRILYIIKSNGDRISIFKSELSGILFANGSRLSITDKDITGDKQVDRTGLLFFNAGVGYSPEFNGQFGIGSGLYPIPSQGSDDWKCYNIIPNLGANFEYGTSTRFSAGLAASYQSETLNDEESPYTDKIVRMNLAARFVLNLNKRNRLIDHYIGIHAGTSYWTDGISEKSAYFPNPYIPRIYFINYPTVIVGSFQLFYGVCFYFDNHSGDTNFGIHFELAIGSPYLAETGLTFRINNKKFVTKSK